MTDEHEVEVSGYKRRKPDGKPRTDNESKISDPQQREGAEVISKGQPDGPQGVQRLSRREPGSLETTVEIGGGDTEQLDEHGRRRYRR